MHEMMDANIQTAQCPGCGLTMPKQQISLTYSYNASEECYEKYSELTAYTLSHRVDDFIHQHVVDTYAIQNPDNGMKNITTAFALIGCVALLNVDTTDTDV